MQDLQINCVGHSEAPPACISHNAIFGIRVWSTVYRVVALASSVLFNAKDFVSAMASAREHFHEAKKNIVLPKVGVVLRRD